MLDKKKNMDNNNIVHKINGSVQYSLKKFWRYSGCNVFYQNN